MSLFIFYDPPDRPIAYSDFIDARSTKWPESSGARSIYMITGAKLSTPMYYSGRPPYHTPSDPKDSFGLRDCLVLGPIMTAYELPAQKQVKFTVAFGDIKVRIA